MDLNDLLNIDIKNLADKKYEVLKEHAINKLKEIIIFLENDELQYVANLLSFSPAGDDMGCDNYFIDFSYNTTEMMDLADILYKLAELKNVEIHLD